MCDSPSSHAGRPQGMQTTMDILGKTHNCAFNGPVHYKVPLAQGQYPVISADLLMLNYTVISKQWFNWKQSDPNQKINYYIGDWS